MELASEAIAFAVKAHDGMRRKKSDAPYILHPLEAAVIVGTMSDDQNLIAAAALHDVTALRRKTGAHHIVDLAWHAVEPLCQFTALQLQHAVGCLQFRLNKACDQIRNTHFLSLRLFDYL